MIVYHFIANNGVGGVQAFVRSLTAVNNNQSIVYLNDYTNSRVENEEHISSFLRKLLGKVLILKSRGVVFHTHGATLTSVFWLAKLYGIPVVHTLHNLAIYEAGTYRRKIHAPYFLKGGVKTVSICKAVSNSFEKTYGFPPDFEIYNGIDSSYLKRKTRQVGRIGNKVVFLGRFDVQKNVNLALAVAAALCERRPEVFVELYGRDLGDLDPEKVSLISRYDQISIYPETSQAVETLASAKVCLMTSRFEGFPILILEALAVGTYVVSTDVGGISEILPTCDLTPLSGSDNEVVSSMVGNICRRLETPEDAYFPEKFELKTISMKYSEVYRVSSK